MKRIPCMIITCILLFLCVVPVNVSATTHAPARVTGKYTNGVTRTADRWKEYVLAVLSKIEHGFEYKGLNPAKGKVYEATIKALKHNSLVKKRYPHFCQKDSLDPDE